MKLVFIMQQAIYFVFLTIYVTQLNDIERPSSFINIFFIPGLLLSRIIV